LPALADKFAQLHSSLTNRDAPVARDSANDCAAEVAENEQFVSDEAPLHH
jgi:hypothetical protein